MKKDGTWRIYPNKEWKAYLDFGELDFKKGRPALVLAEIDDYRLVCPLTSSKRKNSYPHTWKNPETGFLYYAFEQSSQVKEGYIRVHNPFGFSDGCFGDKVFNLNSLKLQSILLFLHDIIGIKRFKFKDDMVSEWEVRSKIGFNVNLVNFNKYKVPSIILHRFQQYNTEFAVVIQSLVDVDNKDFFEKATCNFKLKQNGFFALDIEDILFPIPFHLLLIRTIETRRIRDSVGVLTNRCSNFIVNRLCSALLSNYYDSIQGIENYEK